MTIHYKVGDRVQWTSNNDGGMSRQHVGDVRGTVARADLPSGRLIVHWDELLDRRGCEVQGMVWPDDIEPVDAITQLGEIE